MSVWGDISQDEDAAPGYLLTCGGFCSESGQDKHKLCQLEQLNSVFPH